MLFQFASAAILLLVAIGFIVVALFVGKLLRPTVSETGKSIVYECGERPATGAWFNFNPRFYLIALVFVVFDVEVALMFPVVRVFQSWIDAGWGWLAFAEIAAFTIILFVALVYVWRMGDLEWLKRLAKDDPLLAERSPRINEALAEQLPSLEQEGDFTTRGPHGARHVKPGQLIHGRH